MHADSSAFDIKIFTFVRVDELRLPLVNRFYSSCDYRVKCGRFDRVYSLEFGGKIIAAARLIAQESGHFVLRNLCVAPVVRNHGIATHLVGKVLDDLRASFTSVNCYCYALPHLKNFYLSLGFIHLTPEQHSDQQKECKTVPEDIAEIHFRNCARKRGWMLMEFVIT